LNCDEILLREDRPVGKGFGSGSYPDLERGLVCSAPTEDGSFVSFLVEELVAADSSELGQSSSLLLPSAPGLCEQTPE